MKAMHIFRTANFKRFVVSYVFILLIPLAVTLYISSRATEVIERHVVESNTAKLRNFRDDFDGKLAHIDRSVLDLSFNIGLRRITHMPLSEENLSYMYWFYSFFHDFNRFAFQATQNNDRIFLFLRHNDVVYGRNFFSSDFWNFYGDFMQFGDLPKSEFKHMLFGRRYFSHFMPATYVTFLGREGLYIPYMFSMPASYGFAEGDTALVWGAVVYLLNANEIYNQMSGLLDEYGSTFILDRDRLIASTGEFDGGAFFEGVTRAEGVSEIAWNGSDVLAIYVPSQYSNLSFLSVLPIRTIRADMISLRNTVVGLISAALFIGIGLSAAFSYRNALPITRLLSSNTDLQETLKKQRRTMDTLYIDRMLKNDFASAVNPELDLRAVGLEFGANSYRVILVRIMPNILIPKTPSLDDWDMYRAFVANIVEPRHLVHTLTNNELAIIASFRDENSLEAFVGEIQEAFCKRFGFAPFCGIGEEYGSQSSIHHSLQEAVAAADSAEKTQQGAHFAWFTDISPVDTDNLFGKEQENMLINLVRQGDHAKLVDYMDAVYEDMRAKGRSGPVKQLYLSQLHVILVRLAAETKASIDFRELEKNSAQRQVYFASIKDAYQKLCAHLHKSKKGRKEKLKESMLLYVNENFHNSELNVAMLAQQFNMADNYFSQFFSEQVGEPFSRYLERVRIEHACKLLEESNLTIDKVALKTGYYNTNTFRRAFKRVMGTSPSNYVKI